jgi:segregation and condensation protein B
LARDILCPAQLALQPFSGSAMILRSPGPAGGAGRETGADAMDSPFESSFEESVGDATEQSWSVEEIERLYRQALDTVDAVANDLNAASDLLSGSADAESLDESATGAASTAAAEQSRSAAEAADTETTVGPEQVIEALLFVGGKPLTIKTLGAVLRGEFDPSFIETALDRLRERYAAQNRPYEIRVTEDGYALGLRAEFESDRSRLYGFGPRQVRLSQETLEVLSLVAYRQPISRRALEEIGKRGAGSHLRQLLQRELLVLDRGEGAKGAEATYRTSPRFLQLFGLRRLEELPQIEDLDFK